MDGILSFVAEHDVAIGIAGTMMLMLAAGLGFTRQRRDGKPPDGDRSSR